MITVSNVSVQFGKRVLFNDVNLKFTVVTVMVLSVLTVPENLLSCVPYPVTWILQPVLLCWVRANASPF